MIAQLRGRLAEKRPDRVLIDVGGVGYEVHIPLSTFHGLEDSDGSVELKIYTHVKEDALLLYGFLTRQEKELFVHLISVSGIGPRLAITLLSGLSCDDVIRSIQHKDVARLTSIPGIGKKTAERLVLELKDRVDRIAAAPPAVASSSAQLAQEDVISALVNLGYARNVAEKAVSSALRDEPDATVGSLLKSSLKKLSSPHHG